MPILPTGTKLHRVATLLLGPLHALVRTVIVVIGEQGKLCSISHRSAISELKRSKTILLPKEQVLQKSLQ